MVQLQELDLNNTQVDDTGLEHIGELTHFQQLCLNGTKVTDAGLEYLEGLMQLQQLYSTIPGSPMRGWNTSMVWASCDVVPEENPGYGRGCERAPEALPKCCIYH